MKIDIFTESIQCRLEKLSNPPFYLATIGYYRTAVGYHRVIAQKVLKSKSSHQDLLKTQKNIEIGPITVENVTNENRLIFFCRKGAFSLIFLLT